MLTVFYHRCTCCADTRRHRNNKNMPWRRGSQILSDRWLFSDITSQFFNQYKRSQHNERLMGTLCNIGSHTRISFPSLRIPMTNLKVQAHSMHTSLQVIEGCSRKFILFHVPLPGQLINFKPICEIWNSFMHQNGHRYQCGLPCRVTPCYNLL